MSDVRFQISDFRYQIPKLLSFSSQITGPHAPGFQFPEFGSKVGVHPDGMIRNRRNNQSLLTFET